MRVAFITPTSLLHLTEHTGYHLALPQPMRQHSRYYNFYRSTYGFKILDNGVAEGLPVDASSLISLANLIGANEIVIPDALYDSLSTIHMVDEFEEFAKANPRFSYMGVVQGKDNLEALRCMDTMADRDYVDTIGLPKCLSEWDVEARPKLAQQAMSITNKPIHCLGSAPSAIMEVSMLAEVPNVRGIDTSLPIFAGMWGFDIKRDNVEGAFRPDNYFDMTIVDEEELSVIKRNQETFLEWARAT